MNKYIPTNYTIRMVGKRASKSNHLARARELANYIASKNHSTYAQIYNENEILIETFYYDDAGSTHWKRHQDL